ncbi:potassium uptake protein, TrkH family [Zhouia amylolytica]|uniref:Potassium uptake protein, TrkH family n=1 Tax=Zhouia amylolytica TaxID=376730 RepID=A0A1I6PHE0_9FLAO|nr:potassium transporter TrkG [Zhouia amylolytica]SFS39583.1 potassium uptake protein, TrkH family [Zhouia amylolytica]
MKKLQYARLTLLIVDFIVISFLVFDFGFIVYEKFKTHKLILISCLIPILLAVNIFRYYHQKKSIKKTLSLTYTILFSIVLVSSFIIFLFSPERALADFLLHMKPYLEGSLLLYLIIRLSILIRYLYSIYFNPAIIFVGSFFIIDLLGAFLLMLPKATTQGNIHFIDALFTATSAVCVTGLAVLDTSKDFTTFGQSIILFLIQLGGLGILTFTSFFAFFFRSGSSFKEGLYLKDFVSSENLKDTLRFAMQIVTFTLGIEALGSILIYFSLDHASDIQNPVFFSVFHSISAFCNAGFSNISNGLFNTDLQFDYSFQWIIMILIILGGLGYNIVFNFYSYFKVLINNLIYREHKKPIVRLITLNSKIVLVTTVILLIAGFAFFGISEFNNTIAVHDSWLGKFTTAAFQSVTPRTAGFNTIDYGSLALPSILFVMLLMWIGGSPASTAGGIKTTTFALATLNILSTAKNKPEIEIGTRSIHNDTIKRAFAILCISLITIGVAILLLLIFEPGKDLLHIAFECFSAYSTVGLSLNLTPDLSNASRLVLILVMFIGRIGMLNILIGLLRRINSKMYQYPKENILIN